MSTGISNRYIFLRHWHICGATLKKQQQMSSWYQQNFIFRNISRIYKWSLIIPICYFKIWKEQILATLYKRDKSRCSILRRIFMNEITNAISKVMYGSINDFDRHWSFKCSFLKFLLISNLMYFIWSAKIIMMILIWKSVWQSFNC